MDLNIIFNNKEEYYSLAIECFNEISVENYESENFDNIVPKSISILIDHNFIPTPCIGIKLNILQNQKNVGSYSLYINEQKKFIDEFLILY